MLNIVDISKQYSHHPILHNIHLNIEKGSIVGLAGPSGSGKSTLLRCIQKLESVDQGAIEYSGTSSFMFQDFELFPHMTVFENLTYAPKLKTKIEQVEQEAWHLLKLLSLENKAKIYPKNLSGGQKQRVALARCLMMKPNILLCDEPTSGLDVATIDDVVQLLKSVHSLGVSMIIASHDLDFLARITQRIIVLKKGHNIADIEVAQLANPIDYLKELYQESIQ